MKKFFSFAMMFAVAAGAFVSCTKDIEPEVTTPSLELSGRTKTITVNAVVAETRTELNDHKLQWADGDKFGVFCVADGGETILGYLKAGAKDTKLEMPAETKYLYCIYPYNEAYEGEYPVTKPEPEEEGDSTPVTSLDKIAVSLPNTALAAFDGKLPMAAKCEAPETDGEVDVVFSPLASIVELNVYADGVAVNGNLGQIVVSTGETKSSGTTAYVDFTTDGDVTLNGLTTSSYVVAATHEAVPAAQASGAKSYIYLAKGKYTPTITVLTEQEDANATEYTFKYEKEIDLEQYLGQTLHLNLAKATVDKDAVTTLWDFSNGDWSDLVKADGSEGSHNGLGTYLNNKGAITKGSDYIQVGKGDNGNQQSLVFTAPVSGTLKLVVSGTNSQVRDDHRGMVVSVNGDVKQIECIVDQNTRQTLEYEVNVFGPTEVKIYSSDGHRIYSIEYTYHKIEPTMWTLADLKTEEDKSWIAENIGQENNKEINVTKGGLTFYNSGETNLKSADSGKCVALGSGVVDKQYVSFTASSSGVVTLIVNGTNSTTPGKNDIYMVVKPGKTGNEIKQNAGGLKATEEDKKTLTFDVNITKEEVIYIYSDYGNRLYSIEYTGSVQK